NIGSVAARRAYTTGATYAASKWAVRGFTYALREDLLGRPMRITTVDPGIAETEFALPIFDGDQEQVDELYRDLEPLQPGDVADCVLFALTRPPNVDVDEIVVRTRNQSPGGRLFRHP